MGETGAKSPRSGNYGGGTYIVGEKLANCERSELGGRGVGDLGDGELSEHEGRASDLAALDGRILLDYLRVTVQDCEAMRNMLRGFLGVWFDRGRGWRGWYDQSWDILDGGIVAACSDPDRAKTERLLVDLPGRACAALGDDLPLFFLWCVENGHITRADYAIDDRAGRLTRERVLDAQATGGLVTRWQNPMTEISQHQGGEVCGWTLYLGARSGEAMVRIYDKAAQQGVAGPWVRFELETKGKLAGALAREYFESGSQAVIGQINRRIRFAVPSGADSNRWRWLPADWWAGFLGSVEPGPALCPGERVVMTLVGMRSYLESQAAPCLAAVLEVDGGDSTWLDGLRADGKRRWHSKHENAIARAREAEVSSARLRKLREAGLTPLSSRAAGASYRLPLVPSGT